MDAQNLIEIFHVPIWLLHIIFIIPSCNNLFTTRTLIYGKIYQGQCSTEKCKMFSAEHCPCYRQSKQNFLLDAVYVFNDLG